MHALHCGSSACLLPLLLLVSLHVTGQCFYCCPEELHRHCGVQTCAEVMSAVIPAVVVGALKSHKHRRVTYARLP